MNIVIKFFVKIQHSMFLKRKLKISLGRGEEGDGGSCIKSRWGLEGNNNFSSPNLIFLMFTCNKFSWIMDLCAYFCHFLLTFYLIKSGPFSRGQPWCLGGPSWIISFWFSFNCCYYCSWILRTVNVELWFTHAKTTPMVANQQVNNCFRSVMGALEFTVQSTIMMK